MANNLLPTALACQVMQSSPSICPLIYMFSIFCSNWPLTLTFHWKYVSILAPPLGVTPFEFRKDFWHQKARVPGLSCGIVFVFLYLAILVKHWLVTGRRRHTWHIPHKSIALAVKTEWCGAGMVIYLEWSINDLYMVQLMLLLPHHLCFHKIQNGLSFWYRLTRVVTDKEP